MRYVSLRTDEQVVIGADVRVTVSEIGDDEVLLTIDYPEGTVVRHVFDAAGALRETLLA